MVKKKDKLSDWEGFFVEFQTESDRATAILGAAFLDEHLGQLITEFLIDDKRAVNELLNPKALYAPLSTFAARITAAYCLGLISEEERDDFRRIKEIRNLFAHNLHGLTFDDKEIEKECKRLQILDRFLEGYDHLDFRTPRSRFTLTVSLLLSWMIPRKSDAKKERRSIAGRLEVEKLSVAPANDN